MKKLLGFIMIFSIIMGVFALNSNAMTNGSTTYLSGGTNNPPSPDGVLYGTVIDFDSIDGDFGTTENYVKILNSNGEELIYELSSRVYFEEQLYTSDDVMEILKNIDRNINYVVRSGKIKYINLHMPEGIFESVEIESCYKYNNKIFVCITFETLVGECTCIAAAYNKEGAMCSAASFEASYNDSYSYDVELEANDGEYVKVFFLDNAQSLKPVCEAKIAYIPTEYGYLLSVNKTDGEYEFEIFTDDGTIETLECAEKILFEEEGDMIWVTPTIVSDNEEQFEMVLRKII